MIWVSSKKSKSLRTHFFWPQISFRSQFWIAFTAPANQWKIFLNLYTNTKESVRSLTDGENQNDYGRHFLDKSGSSFEGQITIVASETELYETLIKTIHECCPDILIGYEIQRSSWGYLCRRAANLNINLTAKLSRMPQSSQNRFGGPEG